MEGGYGYTPEAVGNMTLDQAYVVLMDRKYLRKKGTTRKMGMQAVEVAALADKDGMVKGRTADGKSIKGRIVGKSLARQLMEEEERKKQNKKRKRKGK